MGSIFNATSQFESLQVNSKIAEMHKYHGKYGGSSSALTERELRQTAHATGEYTDDMKQDRKRRKATESTT